MRPQEHVWTDEQFIEAIETSTSKVEVLRKLGSKLGGTNYGRIKIHATKLGLDLAHLKFNFKEHLDEIRFGGHRQSLEEILVLGNVHRSHVRLKRDLLLHRGFLNRCFFEDCPTRLLVEWRGAPLTLHLDHINGNRFDYRVDNLRLLCPNCHTQTSTYAGKNIKAKPARESACPFCKKKIGKASTWCRNCRPQACKIIWPPLTEVVSLIESSNWLQTSKKLGVSHGTLRRWLRDRGVDPKTVKFGPRAPRGEGGLRNSVPVTP